MIVNASIFIESRRVAARTEADVSRGAMDDGEKATKASNLTDDAAAWLALKDRALDAAAEGITIADARQPDRPLIYINQGFERMTGYPVSEVMGRNCRFLQGLDTDASAVAEIRAALADCRPCVVEILNYRRDGTTFWNRLSITPMRNGVGEVTHFIGVQSDVTARRVAEDGLRRSKEALEQDLRMAARVQQALLPPSDLEAGTLRIAHAFHPCDDLAGDGVGIVPLPEHRIGLYLLDVSGHGAGAALLSFTLNHLLSPTVEGALLAGTVGEAPAVVPPARVAERLNRQFPMDRSRQYFTFVYGVIDTRSGAFEYVIAGHPAPVFLPLGGPTRLVDGAGFPIGMIDNAVFEEERLTLDPGDRLYFYTDGVIEALNAAEEEYGIERLRSDIDRCRDLPLRTGLDVIAGSVRDWCGGPLRDDVSLLGVERAARPE
ncbi:MAG: SpoIIE family protein phosphatase [Vicinamibacterales bacterium]